VLFRETVCVTRSAFIALLAVAAAGCGSQATAPPPPPLTTTTAPVPVSPRPMALTVFRVEGGRLRPVTVRVPRTRAVAAAALGALGLSASVSIAGGTATVDLPSATDEQTAEVVYTLTQFTAVRRVDVGGRTGLARADVAAYVPPILVESPPDGATVAQTFHVSGSASVFEATLVVRLVRDGAELAKRTVTASEGAPGRGTFDTTVRATPGALELQIFAPSAADGRPQHEVDEHVTVR
jgi:Immunoglobulin-like domain of bacterial spore germination